jgi:hypothetical protein
MACPICKSKQFFLKDPQDEFEIYEFEAWQGDICFEDPASAENLPEITAEQEVFCRRCSWHGNYKTISS